MTLLGSIAGEGKREPQITQITQIRGDGRSYAIIGAAMEVHRQLGPGYLEAIYHQALALEFAVNGIEFLQEFPLPVFYKEHNLGVFRADFICFGTIIVEIKATSNLTRADHAQVIHYLTASAKPIGILINFGGSSLQYRRIISSRHQTSAI